MNRLLIVDGSNLLFQMFFGMPSRITNAQGKAIQGTLGFTGALLKTIRRLSPTHVAVLFDGEHGTERNDLDPDYKANRPDYSRIPEGETPFSQMDDVCRALDFLNIKHAETVTCEADDWISSYALKYGKEHEVFIMSFDSDFFQLITENVRVVRYRGDNTSVWTAETVKTKYGVPPSLYADMKSLTGDKSDNIKGVYKVGVKTAAQLLEQFGTLENILKNADMIKKPSVRTAIESDRDRLRLNYGLIKLNGFNPVPFSLDETQFFDRQLSTTEVLKGIGLI